MKGYVISEVEVRDDGLADQYRALAARSIERYGGRYLVRGEAPDAVDGQWPQAARLVIVEFPSMERAREWYASDAYAEARRLAGTALSRRLLFADGVA
jgi:uncharacterized protein (DUF1330 family)